MRIFKTLLLAATTLTSPFALAEYQKDHYVGLSVFAGQRLGGDIDNEDDVKTASLSDESAAGLAISWYHSPNKEGELLYSRSEQRLNSHLDDDEFSHDVTMHYLHFGGKIWFNGKVVDTSVSAGLGANQMEPESNFDSESKLSGHLGLGMKYDITEQFSLKADARFFATFFNSDSALFCNEDRCLLNVKSDILWQTDITAGIEYRF